MLQEKYKKELYKIHSILKWAHINTNFDENHFYRDIADYFKEKYCDKFKVASGASKGVLIFKDLGFVLKFPYVLCDNEYELCGAETENGDDCWNYCQAEYERYSRAVSSKVEKAFAAIEYAFNIDWLPVYIQEYCEIAEDRVYMPMSKEVTSINEQNFYCFLDGEWENRLFEYDKDFFCKVKDFINYEEIRDLRRANIGYRNGFPVLVDYASFNDWKLGNSSYETY